MWGKRRVIGIFLVVAVAAIMVISLVFINGPVPKKASSPYWMLAGGDGYRIGQSPEVINANFSSIAWSKNITGDCTAIDANGRLYVVGADRNLTAIDASGNIVWSAPLIGQAYLSPFLGPDGTIHQLTEDSGSYNITTFDPDGHMKWSTSISAGSVVGVIVVIRPPLILSDGSVVLSYYGYNVTSDGYTADNTGCLLRIDNSGKMMWNVAVSTSGSLSAPSLSRDGSILAVVNYENMVVSYTINGTLNWSTTLSLPNGQYLGEFLTIGPDGTIYTPADSASDSRVDLVALNPNGSVKWSCQINPNGAWYDSLIVGDPVALSPTGDIIVSTSRLEHTGLLFDIAPNGTIRWQQPLDSPRSVSWISNPAVVDAEGNILACSASSLFEFDKNGNLLQKFSAPGTVDSVVIGQEGQIYCSSEGQLIAFGMA